jgi:hypothetical protein
MVAFRHGLPQTISADAIAAIARHGKARRLLGAPAGPTEAAGEFRSAAGTGKPARDSHF